ncbi:hypothetical protein SAMN04488033_1224 [Salegentibacter agarivorans]|uniref:Cthe-2314-like HEPN domain-containing protein n=1 Tax=Salegentibacter agarivorans TaxID=345907 RepID=A0A1I2NKM4_9FLAO|nr:hypothetical protein [Salegentibacter agarivorans]SFG03339.1 hypothetical protein SAMN04488033_1224 [Salegentibacter agarivorans]
MNEEFNPNSFENQREMDKIGLELFVHNLKENSFNDAVNELITNLKTELNKEITEFLEFQEQEENAHQNYHLDTYFLEDKLLALSEMNIVYAYKDFEINLKKLISAAYGIEIKEFYKWDSVTDFLRSKKIRYSELNAYQEINDLRKVNNSIKHSTKHIDNKIKSISEFSDLKYMRHYELSAFFKRIKDCPNKFLEALSSEIYRNLYEFNDDRLNKIAELYSLRMDKETATRFMKYLKQKY